MSSVEFTSEAVRGAKFREKLKGYHPEDVDAFLERAATALDQMSARLAEATARAMKAETALASNSEADESVRKTLVLAQRTAEMAVNEAKEEARQIREAAETEAAATRTAAASDADELRAQAENAHAAAVAEAEATVAAAMSEGEARLRDATDRIEADDIAARSARDELAAETVRASNEAVRSLLEQQHQLRADVEALALYLAAERARVLEVLTAAVERFGETLAPTRRAVDIDVAIDREELAKDTPDPATEDSWSFDPAVLDRPENQWWSEGESGPAPASATWAAPLDSNEPLPDWFTTAVGSPADAAPAAAAPAPVETAATDVAADREDHTGVEDPDGRLGSVAAHEAGEPADEDEEPATLLFTLEDEGRHTEDEDMPFSASGKPRKTLLGRRRD